MSFTRQSQALLVLGHGPCSFVQIWQWTLIGKVDPRRWGFPWTNWLTCVLHVLVKVTKRGEGKRVQSRICVWSLETFGKGKALAFSMFWGGSPQFWSGKEHEDVHHFDPWLFSKVPRRKLLRRIIDTMSGPIPGEPHGQGWWQIFFHVWFCFMIHGVSKPNYSTGSLPWANPSHIIMWV